MKSRLLRALVVCVFAISSAFAVDTQTVPNHVYIQGNLQVGGSLPQYARTYLAQEGSQPYDLALESWRQHDAFATVLSGTSSSDDLGLYGGTYATNQPYIATGDVKAAGTTTRKARIRFKLPPEYVAGQSIFIRAAAGMITTVADGSATIDFAAYETGRSSVISGSDLVTTSATSINSTTFQNKDFTLTATGLTAGDTLDILMTIIVVDAASATAVIGAAAEVEICLSIKG